MCSLNLWSQQTSGSLLAKVVLRVCIGRIVGSAIPHRNLSSPALFFGLNAIVHKGTNPCQKDPFKLVHFVINFCPSVHCLQQVTLQPTHLNASVLFIHHLFEPLTLPCDTRHQTGCSTLYNFGNTDSDVQLICAGDSEYANSEDYGFHYEKRGR